MKNVARKTEHPLPNVPYVRRGSRPRPEFPGCRPVRIASDEISSYEGRYEVWEAETETAWMVREPTTPYHERPSRDLVQSVRLIAALRGVPINGFGAGDIVVRNPKGERVRILQADEMLHLRPEEALAIGDAVQAFEQVGGERHPDSDPLPDVVLEVDLTTDVRRGKLGLYESCGFPEVWVHVPEHRLPSSPKGAIPGLTIHVNGPDGFREAAESVAFPSWTAAEIHLAINEPQLSPETTAALRRVGALMAERDGGGPDLFLRLEREESRAEGRAEGRVQGHAEGLTKGEAIGVRKTVEFMAVLASRGISPSPALVDRFGLIARIDEAKLLRLAMNCRDEADLLERMGAAASRGD
ncbi:MAG: hypothetical protein OXH37_07005 [Gammaproteobacteria bacterium]|nr:hypothetical protein [Gammaproteobacteria bacterium]